MSRSTYIWVILDDGSLVPVAAFTVKHELSKWLTDNGRPTCVEIYRLKDRGTYINVPPVRLDPLTLEPIPRQKNGDS